MGLPESIRRRGGYRTVSFGICKINHCINTKLSSSLNTYEAPKIIMASKEKNKCNAYCEFKWTPTKPNNVLLQGHCSEVEIV
jgi:hypothetical protein